MRSRNVSKFVKVKIQFIWYKNVKKPNVKIEKQKGGGREFTKLLRGLGCFAYERKVPNRLNRVALIVRPLKLRRLSVTYVETSVLGLL